MRIQYLDSITAITAAQWNSVTGIDHPFTRHEFLHALETSGATNRKSGWQPQHMLVFDDRSDELLAVMPLYLKYHSYGEYVFDWSWANAWHRAGREYYPKLLAAIPYTPATGPRLCSAAGVDSAALLPQVAAALKQYCADHSLSSAHILFPEKTLCDALQQQAISRRRGVQYHWFNRGYQCFEDFLADFSSRKRKNLNKERRRVREQGLSLQVLCGADIPATLWERFYHFYQLTYARRSGHGGYLSQAFFEHIAHSMAEHLVMVLAYEHPDDPLPIAGALNFRDSHTLYGRYWGCIREFDFLHFETCYYQGIDYCIAQGLQRFDPGAQGEHKIQRGFTPVETWSNHWITDPEFRLAVEDFLHRDNADMLDYLQRAGEWLPFRQSPGENTD